ncbi:MAG: hypothetical protein ACTSQP_06295 [Promethearchaeota archaeon]
MAALSINSIIILITCWIIFGVFFLFDLFRREEKYDYLAYIMAVIPVNYMWYLIYKEGWTSLDILNIYTILFALWNLCLLRDIIGVKRKNRDFDDVLLFLALGILVQLIITAILPAEQVNPEMQENTAKFWYFYLPNVYDSKYNINSWVNTTSLMGFRIAATILILLATIPMILDIKGEDIAVPALIIIVAIFIPPFLYLSYIWVPQSMAVLTLLFSVILFIVLLLITKSEE